MTDPGDRAPSEEWLIAELLAHVPHRPSPEGPGDDAAVLGSAPGARVVTTDALIEGVHFLRDHPPEALGVKCLAVNLSDVAAMGATPEAFVVSAALPRDVTRAWWSAFCRGLGGYAASAGVVVAGGDTVASPGPIALSLTAWGSASTVLTRGGGRPGDVLVAAGVIGRSAVGLARWLGASDRAALAGDDEPCLVHHLRPEPPLWAGPLAAGLGASAGMDLSDGLATDLPRLARASGVELVVELLELPEDPALAGVDTRARAAGGEDYAFVALAPPPVADVLVARGFFRLGHAQLADAHAGPRVLWRRAGEAVSAPTPGFVHF